MPASGLLMDIGDRLRERREEMGLTQKETAKLLEVSETFYGEVERGNKRLSLERIILARDRMNLDITYLLTGERISRGLLAALYEQCPEGKEEILDGVLRNVVHLYE